MMWVFKIILRRRALRRIQNRAHMTFRSKNNSVFPKIRIKRKLPRLPLYLEGRISITSGYNQQKSPRWRTTDYVLGMISDVNFKTPQKLI